MSSEKAPHVEQNIYEVVRDLRLLRESKSNDTDKINYLISLIINHLKRHDYICQYDLTYIDYDSFMQTKCLCCENTVYKYEAPFRTKFHASVCAFYKN